MRPRRILVIEDEADIRRLVGLALGRVGGYEVLAASSGAAGVEQARSELPDAILLDVMMPGLDGPATLRLLQDDPATAAIPVLFFTAKVMSADRDRLLGLGARGLIAKPFEPLRLAEQVSAALAWDRGPGAS